MELDLQHLLRLLRRWWWLLLLAPMIGGFAAAMVSSQQPSLYSASATLLLNPGTTNASASAIRTDQDLAATYSLWITSRPVLERAAKELDLPGGASFLGGRVSASPVPGTLFIIISASDTDPERAAAISNTVAKTFILHVQDQAATENEQILTNIDSQIEDTREQMTALDDEISQLENGDTTLSAATRERITTLQTSRDQLAEDLSHLQTTARSIDVELASAQTRMSVSSPAFAPGAPYAPATGRAIMLGVIAGIALAVGAILLLEYLDNTVRSSDEVVQLLKAPMLATVATAPRIKKEGRQLFVLRDPKSSASEAIRLLRANLEFAGAAGPISTLAISSSGKGEGKSTIAANLGVVMAQAGLKTVIIDADLRRPTQHRLFGVANENGLSTLLTRPDQDWRTAAIHLSIPHLTLLPSGPLPPNPSDLLSLGRFDHLLAEISESADIVLIDTPPVLAVSDPLVVATRSDAVILVCQAGRTRRDSIRRATGMIKQGRIRFIGAVMNQKNDKPIAYAPYVADTIPEKPAPVPYYYGKHASDAAAARFRPQSSPDSPGDDQTPVVYGTYSRKRIGMQLPGAPHAAGAEGALEEVRAAAVKVAGPNGKHVQDP